MNRLHRVKHKFLIETKLIWLFSGLILLCVGTLERESWKLPNDTPNESHPLIPQENRVSTPDSIPLEFSSIDYSLIPDELLAFPKSQTFTVASSKPSPVKHQVRQGESLWSIAKQYNIDVSSLVHLNQLKKNRFIRSGQTLLIPPGNGIYYHVAPGESLWEICQRYRVRQNDVLSHNDLSDPGLILAGQRLFLPNARVVQTVVTDLIWPLRGRLSSGFGYRQYPMGGGKKMHKGIDVAAPIGRIIRAAQTGKVSYSGYRGQLGKAVILQHSDGYETVYGHNSELLVKKGQSIQQGQAIARVGSTGQSTGPHLHFELRKNDRAIDPTPYLP